MVQLDSQAIYMTLRSEKKASRLLAIFLALGLALANPAFALRGPQKETKAQQTGLESALLESPAVARSAAGPSTEPAPRNIEGLRTGLEEGVKDLGEKLRDMSRSAEELREVAEKLARMEVTASQILQSVLMDEKILPKNRIAAAVGLALQGYPQSLEHLQKLLASSDEDLELRVQIARVLPWFYYRRPSEVKRAFDVLEKAARQIQEQHPGRWKTVASLFAQSEMELNEQGTLLNYETVFLLGRTQEFISDVETQANDLSLTADQREDLLELLEIARRPTPERRRWIMEKLGDSDNPFAILLLERIIREELKSDPTLGELQLEIVLARQSALVSLAQAVRSNMGELGKSRVVRNLRQVAIRFARENLDTSRIQNPILKETVKIHWEPILRSDSLSNPHPTAGLEEWRGVFERIPASEVSAGVVHVVDWQNFNLGIFLAKIQSRDPVVILASGLEEERQLLRMGFVGENRIVLNVNSFDSLEQAMAIVEALSVLEEA